MITTYQDYITEKNNYTEKDPEFYYIFKYEWKNGKLDCYQDVNLYEYKLSKLPFQFGRIYGEFAIIKNKLLNLDGCPQIVDGDFYCSEDKKLTSMEGCPRLVKKNFIWSPINLKKYSIEDYPLCIIETYIHPICHFTEVLNVVKENEEKFIPLLDNKIAFHQMVMRLNPDLIQYYTTIKPPLKKSFL